MSVPVDDNESFNDLQLDFSRKNHAFNLDNVGYISKELNESHGKYLSSFLACLTISQQSGMYSGIKLSK